MIIPIYTRYCIKARGLITINRVKDTKISDLDMKKSTKNNNNKSLSYAYIDSDAILEANSLFVGEGAKISKGVEIRADKVHIGFGVEIKENVKIGLSEIKPGTEIFIGDYTVIHNNVRASVPICIIGDYGTIHEQAVIYGDKKCVIGHNCWVGQNTVLNSKAELIIRDNFRIGVQSQVWTHVASGELIEGCKMYKVAPTIIEDDVWLVGHVIVSPGLAIAKKTVVFPGSVVTKDTLPGHCYSGTPAQDITEKYNPYNPVTLKEKFDMMKKWVDEFVEVNPQYKKLIWVTENVENLKSFPENSVIFTQGINKIKDVTPKVTFFDLETKKYTKRRSPTEIAIIKYLMGHRARFTP